MVNGSRAIKSSDQIRKERIRRLERIKKTTRPVTKRSQQAIRRGRMNIKKIFDPQSRAERLM